MTILNNRIQAVINQLPAEFRVPVYTAARHSDGTVLSFQQELSAQTWDYPELPIQEIMDKVCYDVA